MLQNNVDSFSFFIHVFFKLNIAAESPFERRDLIG